MSPLLSNVLGYATGLLVAYQLNLRFVFKPISGADGRLARFLGAFVAAFVLNLAVLQVALCSGVDPRWAQLLSAIPYLVSMYLLGKHWVYRERSA